MSRPSPTPAPVDEGDEVDPGNLQSTLSTKTQRKLDRSRVGEPLRQTEESTEESSLPLKLGKKRPVKKEKNEVEMVEIK